MEPPRNLPAPAPQDSAQFVPSLTVIAPGKIRVEVPVSLAAAKSYAQMTTARMMSLLMKKFEAADPEEMDIKSFRAFAETHEIIAKSMLAAFGMSKKTPNEDAMSEFASLAGGLVRNIAAGAAEGAVSGAQAEMRAKYAKIRQLGLGREVREPRQVVEAEIVPEPSAPASTSENTGTQ